MQKTIYACDMCGYENTNIGAFYMVDMVPHRNNDGLKSSTYYTHVCSSCLRAIRENIAEHMEAAAQAVAPHEQEHDS